MKGLLKITCLLSAITFANNALATLITVSELAPSNSAQDTWMYGDMRDGGTASIVSVIGLGGNLENNAPLGNDAVRLTTGTTNNNDKAEIVIANNFGTVSSILSTLSISYDYYRENAVGENAFAAPSLKLGFYNSNCQQGDDCYFQLIYEPYLNATLADSQWTNIAINFDLGDFWNTGGFGLASGGGGCPCLTLEDTQTSANSNFDSAVLTSVALGIGTYNRGVTGYIDNVSININDNNTTTYDFERVEVPEPSSIAIFSLALLSLGFRNKQKI